MEIDLPPELAAQINDLIRTGDYKDVLDVIIHAVALLYEETFGEPSKLLQQIEESVTPDTL
jgi:Arc/MetJ-type ribon-helix-helix transcriptional regulator